MRERDTGYGEKELTAHSDHEDPDLVSSACTNGMHAPVIDLDFPCRLIPSSTPGHFHLYLDQYITWEQCQMLLEGFFKAGLIEEGWYKASLRDGRSYVRRPGIYKAYDDLKEAIAKRGKFWPDD
jgi:hypothetical protein